MAQLDVFMQTLLQWGGEGITYSECVFIALGIQHAMCMCHIALCGLSPLQQLITLSHK